MIEVMDERKYLLGVVREFQRETAEYQGLELKRRLWHSCIVVCEVTETNYRDWHLTLSRIALRAGLSERDIVSTVMSARRKAGVA
jgi:hypothetical protein